MADDAPDWDDIPSWDKLPDASAQSPGQQQSAAGSAPAWDDIPDWDNIPEKPAPEGRLAAGARAAAHGVVPAAGAAVGMGAGAAMGAPFGPVGALVGGVIGGIAGGMGGDVIQNKAQEAIPAIDDRQQQQANEEAYPIETGVAGMLPFAGNPGRIAGSLAQRGAGAVMMGGLEAGEEAYNNGNIDPAKVAATAAFGAAFPNGNRVTNAITDRVTGAVSKFVPGRPGRLRNTSPEAEQAHADVRDDSVETAVGDSVLAESPPQPTGETVGKPPENSPTNSKGEVATGEADGSYAKTTPAADTSQVTTGDMDPATSAALQAASPAAPQQRPFGMPPGNYQPPKPAPAAEAPIPGFDDHPSGVGQQPPARKPVASDEGLVQASQMQREAETNARQKIASQQLDQEPPSPVLDVDRAAKPQNNEGPQVVDTGMPKPGDAIAAGENDATPMPHNIQEIMKPIAAPEITGETVAPKSLAQAEAGNFKKARTTDFGKPIALETRAGEVRKGKDWEHELPYDYGYFNKTKGPDGDHIDFVRPQEGSPEFGDKHFIIDQKNETTGKYDEPKVFTYLKDKSTAVDLYNRGFGDGKGPQRMHDITEVSRGDLVKYLVKHTSKAPTKPYGKPIAPAPKPVKERAVFKDLVAKKPELAEALKNAPDEAIAQAIEGKRTRKYGVETGASAGYPVKGIVNSEGKPVTANTKAKADERSAVHKQMADWFEGSKPKKETETNGEILDRLKSNPFVGKAGGWVPAHKPKEWLLAAAARDVTRKPTPGNIAKFKDAERLLRSGDERAVDTYRSGNRIESDIAKSRRSGDEALAGAEAEASHTGRNDVEEKMLENIGKQRGDFDVPHEEAETMVKPREIKTKADIRELPKKTVDVRASKLAEKPVAKMSLKELTEAKPQLTKTEEFKPAEAANLGKSVKGKFTAEDMARMVELSNKAAGRKGLTDEEILRQNPLRDLGRDFLGNESGALGGPNNAARGAAVKRLLAKAFELSKVHSFRAGEFNSPTNRYANKLFEDLHLNDNLNTMHKLENLRKGDVLDRDADRASLERIYKAREADSAHVDLPGKVAGKTNIESLGPGDTKIWNEHIKPMLDEANEFKDLIRKLDPNRIGPDVEHYIARITKGDTSEYNMLRKESDPTGPQYNGLGVSAGMAKERAFTVLERKADGKRFVVMERPNGFTLWDGGKGVRIKDPSFEFEANQPYTVKGKKGNVDYTMRHATADEIERSGAKFDLGKGRTMQAKYYKNAGLSAILAHAKLGEMARNLQELARIASTKEFQDRTTRNADAARDKGYIETRHPNFKGTYMDPRLAHLLDDYAKPGFNSPQALRDLNQGVTKLLFWMPTAHIANVGTHWFVGRGFDWATLPGWHRLAMTAPRAIRSVLNQDITQQRLMANGVGTIYPSVHTRNFIDQVAKSVGEEMEREPSKWGPVADAFGVPLGKLSKAIYDNSSKVMWAANDMFLTQRIMELEAKGLSTDQAIKQAERDIPNYRVPPQLFTGAKSGKAATWGRIMSQVFSDPMVSSFGRYHVGIWNSYANIFKDAFSKESSLGDRVDAAGKMMAMGVLAFAVYPMLDKFAQVVTGNEDAEQQRRGPVAIPTHIAKALQGKEDVLAAGRATLTVPPFWSTVFETLANKDWRGKPIVEPGDVAAGAHGSVYRGGKAVVQEAEHAARGLISPLGTFSTAEKKADEPGAVGVAKAAGRAVRDQALDQKNPSDASRKFMRKQDVINDKNARLRERKGGYGPLEEGYSKIFGN